MMKFVCRKTLRSTRPHGPRGGKAKYASDLMAQLEEKYEEEIETELNYVHEPAQECPCCVDEVVDPWTGTDSLGMTTTFDYGFREPDGTVYIIDDGLLPITLQGRLTEPQIVSWLVSVDLINPDDTPIIRIHNQS